MQSIGKTLPASGRNLGAKLRLHDSSGVGFLLMTLEERKAKKREHSRQWRKANPEYHRNYRARTSEKQRQYHRQFRIRHPDYASKWAASGKMRETFRRYYLKHPEQAKARKEVARAIRLGRLVRPDRCSQCGTPCKAHGHHPDYSKPLEVLWLCLACHLAEHGKEIITTKATLAPVPA